MFKRIVVFLLSFIFLVSCTTESAIYASKPLYSIISSSHSDISGNYEQEELLVYAKTDLTGTDSITISQEVRDGKSGLFQLILRMNHMDWQFPNSISLNIDDQIKALTPSHSDKNVLSGRNVEETYYFNLDSDIVNKMRSAKKLLFQIFKDEVITVTPEGVKAVNDFLGSSQK